MSKEWKNQLYFGDNLDILKQLYSEHPEGFIDLTYIDPPFNSKRNYNVLFESIDLKDSTAQKEAFADTWSNVSYMDTLNELSELDISLYNFLKNLDNTNISKGAISYLVTMAIRLWYMHKLLKDTGSFYLHCDPTMSHYLKILCDLIFGERNFKNEIIWKRAETVKGNFGQGTRNYDPNTDTILFYSKSSNNTFNQPFKAYTKEYIDSFYKYIEPNTGRKYQLISMTAPGDAAKGNPEYEVMGIKRFWRFSEKRMKELIDNGMVVQTKVGNVPRKKQYLDEGLGVPIQTFWDDIKALAAQDAERLGYPTQKPEILLERIIKASSNEGDIVADFFCGCGTTIAVAEKLKRKWVGVDISHLAVKLITKRLIESYSDNIMETLVIHGFPKDIDSARELANNVKGGRLEFEDWIIEVLLHGITNERRNEMGFDGYRTFSINGQKYVVMMEVKSGNASPTQLNHFIKTVEDRKGAMGVFICFKEQITHNMEVIAKKEGLFKDQYDNTYKDKIQIISIEDLLEDKRPQIPLSTIETFKKAEKKSTDQTGQGKLEL
jgi:DNA modification methylase